MVHVKTIYGLEICICILNAIISISIGYLSGYHVWLKLNGLSTYGHIMIMRERARRARSSYIDTDDNNEPP